MTYTLYQLDETDSTSTHAFRLLQKNTKLPFVVWAKTQTSGKGRLGTRWHSPVGNLYLTFALPIQNLNSIELTPIKTAVFLAKWIQQHFHFRTTIKWPNDILFAGKKIAGILCELSTQHQNSTLFVGIGINVSHHPLDLPYETTSLNEIRPASLSLNQIGHSIIKEWSNHWDSLNKKQIFNQYYQFHTGSNQLWLNNELYKPHLLYEKINDKGYLVGHLQNHHQTNIELASTHHSYQWIYQHRKKSPATAILIADIGNSQTKIAFFSHFKNDIPDDVHYIHNQGSIEESIDKAKKFLNSVATPDYFKQQQVIYYASVNEKNTLILKKIFSKLDFSCSKIEKRPIFLNTDYAWNELGIDRVANMEACFSKIARCKRQSNNICIIISAGTATVCDIVKANGKHLGGNILPGIQFSLTSLAKETNLPLLKITSQTPYPNQATKILGQNTKDALATGIIQMSTSYIKSLQKKIRHLYPNTDISTFVTGGMSFSLVNEINAKTVPHLTVQGLKKMVTGGT